MAPPAIAAKITPVLRVLGPSPGALVNWLCRASTADSTPVPTGQGRHGSALPNPGLSSHGLAQSADLSHLRRQ